MLLLVLMDKGCASMECAELSEMESILRMGMGGSGG